MNAPTPSRRTLLRSLAVVGASLSAPALLTACDTKEHGSVSNTGKKAAALPAYVPRTVVEPDLAADEHGVQAGFLSYPGHLASGVAERPGTGRERVKVLSITYGTPPKPASHNRFYAAVQKALGVRLDFTAVPEADFRAKMTTVFAGDDLPDIISIGGGFVLPREAEFAQSRCADLTEFLSGDAVKDYPNLANLPPYSWEGVGLVGGRLYGVPIERPKIGDPLWINREALTGAGYRPGMTADDFAAMARRATSGRKWALGAYSGSAFGYRTFGPWHGTPNEWRIRDGEATDMWGTDAFKEMLAFHAKLRANGSYTPNATSVSNVDEMTQFYNGTVLSMVDGFLAYPSDFQGIKGAYTLDAAVPYTVPGVTQHFQQTRGAFGYTLLKKAPKDRVRLLLRVLDYLAAPFGTREYGLTHYGLEGVHFRPNKDNDPVPTPLGLIESNTNLPLKYLCDAPNVLYQPGGPDLVKRLHTWQRKVVPLLEPNDRWGLQSETFTSRGAGLDQILGDGVTSVVAGRKKVSEWDAVYKKWRDQGGARVAEEFLKEHEATR
ncbi:extracellular solute-binding protein [Streptomyces sp. NPDC050560]|uniref:extracellular solute-binding protein n=1 Tax=Streptomyces sp. NPDC050560 TaxID=3365630 RepID=UPI00378A5133